MSKMVKVLVALLAIAAIAAPAMADVKLNGYYRLQGTMQSLSETTEDTSNFVDQRLRLKVTNELNDMISVVWYGEYDAPFGVTGGKTVAGAGGKLSADGVGIETKNAYVDFKVPNSTWSVRTGIQGFGLGSYYEGFVTEDDMNGIKGQGMVGPVKLTVGWFKWDEGLVSTQTAVIDSFTDTNGNGVYDAGEPVTFKAGTTTTDGFASADDIDYYSLAGEVEVSDQFKFGLTADLVQNNAAYAKNGTMAKTDDYYYGGYADFIASDTLGFAGSLLFRNAKGQDSSAVDGQAWMLNLYAKAALGQHGKVKVHAIYIPADDSTTGTDRFSNNQAGWELHSDNLMIFGTDIYYNNGSQGAAFKDAAYAGYGLMGLIVSGDYKLPENSYFKYGAGYFMAADDNPTSAAAKADSDLGLEIAAHIGKKFAEKYDLSLRGAYSFTGDFYDTPTTSVEDTYKVVAMLNISF